MKKKEKIIIYISIIILLLIDQITKIIAINYGWKIENSNTTNNNYHIFISIIIIFLIIRYISNNNSFIKIGTKFILSFAIAGGIGNLIDRIWNKNVILFINFNNHIELNLSYIYILIAWIGMAIILTRNTKTFLNDKKEKNMKRKEKKDENSNK